MKGYKDKETLVDLYIKKKMSTKEIGKVFGVHFSTIRWSLGKFKVPIRSAAESHSLLYTNHCALTQELRDFIYGELLGDGYIGQRSQWAAHIQCVSKYLEYVRWIDQFLVCHGVQRSGSIYKDNNITGFGRVYRYESRRYAELLEIRQLFYPEGKKIIPDIEFSPLVLRQWYLGDGSLTRCENWREFIILCTCGFLKFDVLLAVEKLRKIGFKTTYQPSSNVISISSHSTLDFLDYIGKCPIFVYDYKWDVRNHRMKNEMVH